MADDLDALPVTVLLATEPGTPVTVLDGNAALRMAIVDRSSIGALDEEWDQSGIYLLLDPVQLDGAYGVYVGKAPAGLQSRLRQHRRKKDHWARALLVIRDTTYGWDSSQIGWLEGRLYDLLDGATLATLSNQQRPQDEPSTHTTALHWRPRRNQLQRSSGSSVAPPTRSRMRKAHRRMQGGRPGRVRRRPDSTTSPLRISSRQRSAPGTAVLQADGTVLHDGVTHQSLSAAGSVVRGGKATNGWRLWAVERDGSTVPLATIRARYIRDRPSA